MHRAYYHYDQNSFGAGASCNTAAKSTCSGTFDAVSFVVDWQFAKKFDAYAGFMFSQNNNGLQRGSSLRGCLIRRSGYLLAPPWKPPMVTSRIERR
jgi:hypothetical protein